jgi:hypothetical protein
MVVRLEALLAADPSTRSPAVTSIHLPALQPGYEPTRATLHTYAKAIGAIARVDAIAHPKWWHVSLRVQPEGLVSSPIPLPGGGAMAMTMDLKQHEIVARSSDGKTDRFDLREQRTGTEMGEALIAAATARGLDDRYDRVRFENDQARTYDPAAAEAYFEAFVAVAMVFARHRVTVGDRVGPIQLWPHGFDLAFEWFGTRSEEHDGEVLPAQLNLGFYPGGEAPYFYSNPWPFDPRLTETPLPQGARWNTEGWSGSMLEYGVVRDAADPGSLLAEYAQTVFEAARPTLEV